MVFCVINWLSVCSESNRGPGGLVTFGKYCVREGYMKQPPLSRALFVGDVRESEKSCIFVCFGKAAEAGVGKLSKMFNDLIQEPLWRKKKKRPWM